MSIDRIENLFRLFLEASAAGSLLCLLLLAAKRIRGVTPSVRFFLWSAVLLRFALPVVPESSWSVLNLRPQADVTIAPLEANTAQISTKSGAGETVPKFAAATAPLPWVVIAWMAGIFCCFAVGVGREWLFVRRNVRNGKAYSGPLQKNLRKLATKFSVELPTILETTGSPALIGIFRPKLLIPANLLLPEKAAQFEAVVAHELAHLKRGDILWNRVASFIRLIHWFNPLVWIAVREWRRERELICDQMAVKVLGKSESDTYARTLLDLSRSMTPRTTISGAVNVVGKESELKRRISMITMNTTTNRWLTALVALLFGIAAGVAFTTEKPKNPPVQVSPPENTKGEPDLSTARAKVRAQEEIVNALSASLRKFRTELGIPDEMIRGEKISEEARIERLVGQLLDAQKELQKFQGLLQQLQKHTYHDGLQFLQINTQDAQLERLLSRKSDLELKLSELNIKLSAEHPETKQAKSALAQVEKQIRQRFEGFARGYEINCNALEARLKEISKQLTQSKAEKSKVHAHYEDYLEMQDQLRRAKLKLEAMEQKLRQIEVSNLTVP